MTTSMNEWTHFFIKIYLSHLMLVVCERWVRDGDRLLHIDPSSSDHSSISFSSWLGLLNRESLRTQSPPSVAGSHFGILSSTDYNCNWLKPSVSWFLFDLHLLPLLFRLFTQVDLLIDGSVEGQYVTIISFLFFKIPHVEFFFTSVSILLTHTFYK